MDAEQHEDNQTEGVPSRRRYRRQVVGEMATAADRFNINSQLEHLQAKYVGTGHADLHR